MAFKTIHDLGNLSEKERIQYLADVSVHFGVNPEQNLFDMIWMPSGDGVRKLVVYARRGTTDILREVHGINVTSMRSEENGKTIKFIVSGKNKQGREEWASGSHSVEGLRGKQLEAAEMTSQTRALRRLTLQFVGGGILDVTEIDEKTSDINNSPASLAQLSGMPPAFVPPQAPPMVVPNNAPGKVVEVTEDQLKALKVVNIVSDDIEPIKTTVFPPEQISSNPTISASFEIPKQFEIESDTNKKIRRGRKRRNTVDLSSPGQTSAATPVPQEGANGNGVFLPPPSAETIPPNEGLHGNEMLPNHPPSVETIPPNAAIVHAQIPVPAQVLPVVPVQVEPAIAPEKIKVYRERLNKYISDILPREGKMMPSEGIGGTPNKLRKFAFVFSGVEDVKKLTEDQWEQFLGFLDSYYQQNGAVALTAYINSSIGAQS